MVTKTVRIKVNAQEVVQLNDELEEIDANLEEVEEGAEKTGGAFAGLAKFADKFTGGLASKLTGLKTGLGGVAIGFKSVGVAIAASGIGLLVIVIASVIAAFKASEEGQNKFAKLMGVIGSVLGNLMDLFTDIGDLVIGLFSDDGEAMTKIKSFGKSLWDFIGLPIKNIIDITTRLGKAIGDLFSGDIEAAMENLNGAVDDVKENFNEAADAADRAKEAIRGFAEEVQREARIASGIAQLRAMANVKERELLIQRAEANRDIAALREKIANDEKFSTSERLKFVEEASIINENIVKREIEQAQLLAEAKKAENRLTKSTIEDKLEQAQLEANVIDLQTRQLALQRRLTNERQTLLDEQRAENKPGKQTKELFLPTFGGTFDDFQIASQVELDLFAEAGQARIRSEQDIADASVAIAQEAAAAKVESYMLAADGFAVASRLIGQETAAGKAFAVASTLISTYFAAQQAYASQLAIPSPDAPIRAAVAAGVAIAGGLANVKSILSIKVPGEGAGSSPGGGSPSRPPAFNVVGNSPSNQLNQSLLEQGDQPVQAFVVEGEVSSAEQLRRDKIETSSIG